MLYFFKFLLLLVDVKQETLLNWLEIGTNQNLDLLFKTFENDNIKFISIDQSSSILFKTLKSITEELCQKVQEGLTLVDIENILFFILFSRFIILIIRYNLKTSFYITCIGLFAGYLWYRHLIDLISMYRSILIKLPYFHKLGIDAVQLRTINRQLVLTNLKLGENIHWYNPGQLLYYGFINGIIHNDLETGLRYYYDPISMIISNLNDSDKIKILPIYYKIYNSIIPQISDACSKFWTQLSGIAAYAVVTRIGKRYCPYLIRWHWTFLLIIGFIEQILIYFVYRVSYFQTSVLIPQTQSLTNYVNTNLLIQINFLNGVISFIIILHLGLVFFGLFHAICGQYFYFPFLVENTELHIGLRPKTSIYSGGYTAWQDEKEKNIQSFFPKFWYGWFGKGTTGKATIFKIFQKFFQKLFQK